MMLRRATSLTVYAIEFTQVHVSNSRTILKKRTVNCRYKDPSNEAPLLDVLSLYNSNKSVE